MWRRYLSTILATLVTLTAGCSAEQAEALRSLVAERTAPRAKRVELQSYSIVVPRDEVSLMLRAVTRLVDDGFGGEQIAEVMDHLDRLEQGDVLTKRFSATADGRPIELEIQVFLDRPEHPELFFFAPEPQRREIARYGEDLKQMLRDRDQYVDGRADLVDASPGSER
jgi:hypothetical protein